MTRRLFASFTLFALLLAVAATAQAAQPPDTSRFHEVAGSGGSILRDNNSGLEWQRCPHGQSWTGSSCTGAPWEGNWEAALQLTAAGGFRLPTRNELETLLPFPFDILPGYYMFWTSSPETWKDYIWFFTPNKIRRFSTAHKNTNYSARLVR